MTPPNSPDLRPQLRALAGMFCFLSGVLVSFACMLGSVGIHVWSVILAYRSAGIFAAFVSIVFPFVAWIFWAVMETIRSGTLLNPFCLGLLAIGAGVLAGGTLLGTGIWLIPDWRERLRRKG